MLIEVKFSGMFRYIRPNVCYDLLTVLPRRGVIKLITKGGTQVAHALHDCTDEQADIENLILLCQLKKKGET
jgi:hypothetical protein